MDNRELDTAIAKKVMNCTLRITGGDYNWWILPDGKCLGNDQWSPSTEISAAWQVITRMRQLGWHYELGSTIRDTETARFGRGDYDSYENEWDEEYWGEGDITTAICLAALKAVGVEVSANLDPGPV